MPSRSGSIPAFTIHDREDSADLINLIRHELGFSEAKTRFPTKGTCLAIYSRVVNAQDDLDVVLQAAFPVVRQWGDAAARAVRAPMSRPSSARTCSITTTCCSTGPR